MEDDTHKLTNWRSLGEVAASVVAKIKTMRKTRMKTGTAPQAVPAPNAQTDLGKIGVAVRVDDE